MNIFEEIWNKVSEDDGSGTRVITYGSKDDLMFIYASGFVDADKYLFEQWAQAFQASLQKDGSYRVTFDQWMAKEKFYYEGPVRIPFDAMKIPEKEFTEEELVDFFKKCMVPSSQTTIEKIPTWLDDFTKRSLLKNGKMAMTEQIKKELADFITFYPSPLRVLEVNIQQLLTGGEGPVTAEAAAKTGYKMGATAARTTQAQLDSLLGGTGGQPKGPPQKKEPEELTAKDLQKQIKKRPV